MKLTLAQALDKHLQQNYTEAGPGTALLIARAGEVLYENGRGLADVNQRTPITGETNFRLASVSKQFTAMALRQLQLCGFVSLHDYLHTYLPTTNLSTHITLAHLLNHTSGLPDFEDFVSDCRTEQVTDQEVLHITASQPELLFRPGTHFRYSNTGYVLLALVVEQVSGLSFGDALRKYVFGPLGMSGTVLYGQSMDIPNRAIGYALNAAGEPVMSDQSTCSATKGDGCIYTSLRDYHRWHLALQHNERFELQPVLPATSTTINGNAAWKYGMGWFYSEGVASTQEFYHTGSTCGFSNLVVRVPESQLLIACFTNIADNPHLPGSLLAVLQQYPETMLQSKLIYKLLELTR